MWKIPERNYEGMQFENLRKEVDAPYNEFHDALSIAYYNGIVFNHPWLKKWGYKYDIDFPTLKATNPAEAKRLFDEIHALQDWERVKTFHETNMSKPVIERIPEEKYNHITDGNGTVIGKVSDEIITKISKVKTEKGVELVVIE